MTTTKTFTKTLYIHKNAPDGYSEEYRVANSDLSDCSHIDCFLIATKDVEFEVPAETTEMEIQALQEKEERIRQASRVEIERIKERIANLRCLNAPESDHNRGQS